MTEISGLDRRDVLKRIGLVAVAAPGLSVLSACATGGSDDTKGGDVSSSGDAKNPFGVDAAKPLNVVIFKGGLGDDYATQVHEPMYAKAYPGVKIKHEGIVEIGKALQPRFSSGTDIPDVVANAGTDLMDTGALAEAGHLQDLTALWDAPSLDDPAKKIRDAVLAGAPEAGLVAGKPFLMAYVSSTYGLWYDSELFKSKGWTPPKTFDEFKTLAETIKSEGITPFAYAGKNASYYAYWMILISAAKIGGNQVLIDIDNLKDGAWTSPAVEQAAAAWAEINTKYSDKSFEGLIHTEVQTQQNQGKIAFYPSGSWLENEQAASTPKTFKYGLAPTPSVTASDALPYEAIRVAAGEYYFVSAKGQNPSGGLEYFRQMLSKEGAKGFTEKSGSLTIVQGAAEGLTLSPGLSSVFAAQQAAGNNIVTTSLFENWYKELETELRRQTNNLMYGRSDAKKFCAAMQKAADKAKKDAGADLQTRTA
ncbi:N-acetylglucosamine/diacetylchitobiose ABC transporter substrate-binding protein [Actinocorallia sp. API 0066]|uniref:N-acetylglucosamine/diacetylchitobiose ABC transporter substrate-binding protein n=1 Tax=Actinocorallia sp. API 0066 TaxID=2896846 RepID=UPI001E506932|nr:N-acetylglucosamine/diacetylchitobiose ABC transporter substrate-binding protein [Actinocorallia sp. API 0066]MCD0450073.1 N-acetylglucosamine/diacetylchitobiose ABC transporter substrate-binding protein [Actinocorallia sp. API 0066]